MSDALSAKERSIVQQFGHPPCPDYSDAQLAHRILEFPDAQDGWYVASAITLAAAYLGAERNASDAQDSANHFHVAYERARDRAAALEEALAIALGEIETDCHHPGGRITRIMRRRTPDEIAAEIAALK